MELIDAWSRLPSEMFTHLCSFITGEEKLKITSVCKRWSEFSSFMWGTQTSLCWNLPGSYDRFEEVVERCGDYLKCVRVHIPFEHLQGFSCLLSTSRWLTHLSLTSNVPCFTGYRHENDNKLAAIFAWNQRLRSVRLKGFRITENSFAKIPRETLQEFNIETIKGLEINGLVALFSQEKH